MGYQYVWDQDRVVIDINLLETLQQYQLVGNGANISQLVCRLAAQRRRMMEHGIPLDNQRQKWLLLASETDVDEFVDQMGNDRRNRRILAPLIMDLNIIDGLMELINEFGRREQVIQVNRVENDRRNRQIIEFQIERNDMRLDMRDIMRRMALINEIQPRAMQDVANLRNVVLTETQRKPNKKTRKNMKKKERKAKRSEKTRNTRRR